MNVVGKDWKRNERREQYGGFRTIEMRVTVPFLYPNRRQKDKEFA